MKNKIIGLVILLCLGCNSQIKEAARPPDLLSKTGYNLVFNDEFNGNKLDANKWNIEDGPRNSAINCPQSIIESGGSLKIHTFINNNKYYTGIINTRNKFIFNKGYLEVRAAFNDIPGSWSDVWLFNDNVSKDEINPEINGVEIDVFEHRAFNYYNNPISDRVNFATHYNGYAKLHEGEYFLTPPLDLNKGFHIFGFLWDDNGGTFYIDGKQAGHLNIPYTVAKNFIVIGSELSNHQFEWTYFLPKELNQNVMEIDYIRVYQKILKK